MMSSSKTDISPNADAAASIMIDNKWAPADSAESLDVRSPSDGKTFARISRGGEVDIDTAVTAARRAFNGSAWSRLSPVERGRLLMKVGDLIRINAEALAQLESRDTGKPLKQGRADITAAARYFEYYGSAADKLHGETIPFQDGYTVISVREPIGVIGQIIPWNYPAQIGSRSIAAALAAGNTTVLKPAEEACMTMIRIAALVIEAGFPPGVLNLVTGLGDEAGAPLSAHPDIDFVAFTGSPEVGTLVQQAAARNRVGCILELGGKSPQIIFEDADLEAALPVVVNAIVQNAGQTCSAASRVLIQQTIYDEFIDRLAERFRNLVASSHDRDRDCGAMISREQKEKVQRMLDSAIQDGVPMICQGQVDDDVPASGFYMAPTLLGPVPRDQAIAREEVFGPVLCAIPFSDEADAIAVANGTEYGLVAGVWTRDGARQMRLAQRVRAGQVFVNGYGAGGGIELPFGGMKKSGYGRAKGFEGLRELSVIKTVVIKHDQESPQAERNP